MTDIAIKRHSFDLAQKRLKEFSERTEAQLEIDSVRTDGGFLGLGDHKVTGYELNRRLKIIQSHFITVNETSNRVIKEFREVYNALDALDKDYITSIVANVKAIEKTSNDVRVQQGILAQHHDELKNQQRELDNHQTEIEKSVETISKIVGVLNVFKEKLDGYEHLKDIDKIWSDCQKWHEEIPALLSSLSDTVSTVEANTKDIADVRQSIGVTNNSVARISNSLSEQIKRIEALLAFVEGLKAITHLRDIDGMWDSLSNAHASLEKLFAELESTKSVAAKHQKDIDKALAFIESVSEYEHLKDVDAIWGKVEGHGAKLDALTEESKKTVEAVNKNQNDIAELANYRQGLSSIIHLKEVDNLWASNEAHSAQIEALQSQAEEARNLVQHNKELVDQSLADEKTKADAVLQQLNKKIQYAYWIAGGSMALALIELLVILLG